SLQSNFRLYIIAAKKLLPDLKKFAHDFQFKEELLTRGIHDGFSGGEKKKIEMIQAQYLAKKYALFDEIDTGLDIDALKKVAREINSLKKRGIGCLVITHFARLTEYLDIDRIFVMQKGRLVRIGGKSIIREIEKKGYGHFT
ncbi:MAG: ABC transporter ATP-binding protein, partial [Patescibacteria group bacterium]